MLKEKADRANTAKSTFLSNVSHELRAPLTSIIGYSDLLRTDVLQNNLDEVENGLGIINQAGNDLLRLINDLLDLAKIESGGIDIRPEPTPVNQIIQNLNALMLPLARNYNVVYRSVSLEEDDVQINVDPLRFREILTNLLTNACKYNREGGEVLLLTELKNNKVIINVQDMGKGLTEDQITKI